MDDGRQAPHRRNAKRNVDSLQLTEEERQVLKECRMNSMVRGVPAGITAAILTSFAVRSGRFPHLTHWSRFYYGVTFTGGLLFGVASYRKTCLEKIMKLENSVLADQVREYYKRAGMEYVGPQSRRKNSEFDDSGITAQSHTASYENELDKETVPFSSRLHNEERSDSINMDINKPENTEHRLSFEERRRQHRQQWTTDQYPHPTRAPRKLEENNSQPHDSDHATPATSSDRSQGSSRAVRKNIYGDPIE